jgi:hypothetical protein
MWVVLRRHVDQSPTTFRTGTKRSLDGIFYVVNKVFLFLSYALYSTKDIIFSCPDALESVTLRYAFWNISLKN